MYVSLCMCTSLLIRVFGMILQVKQIEDQKERRKEKKID